MPHRSILILDCTPNKEPSEGRLLKEFFDTCKLYKPVTAFSLYCKVKSKRDFLRKLDTGKRYNIIHISAHGTLNDQFGLGNGSTWLATPEEIAKTNNRATLVFANACSANRKILADAFKGSKFFLAPKTEVEWINAAMFSLTFYKRYIVDGVSLRNSFKYARNRTQTCKDYPDYWL
jgi:hypothetical protein